MKKNPFEKIDQAKKSIDYLSGKLVYIKNEKAKIRQVDALNSLIVLVNSFEDFLNKKYRLKSVDGLVCGRLYSMFFSAYSDGMPCDFRTLIAKVDDDIKYPQVKKEALIEFLNAWEFEYAVGSGSNFFECEGYGELVDNLLNQFKRQLIWN